MLGRDVLLPIQSDLLRYHRFQVTSLLAQLREDFQHVHETTLVLLPEIRTFRVGDLNQRAAVGINHPRGHFVVGREVLVEVGEAGG